MKHTKEEIINALKVIKEECAAHEECVKCPLYDNKCCTNTVCSLDRDSAPSSWDLNDTEDGTWRAFK